MTDRLFQEVNHANLYAKYRPTYPKQLTEKIITFMKNIFLNGNFDAAVDIGCGTGQLTRDLASYFKTVIGIDVSKAQLQCARYSTSSTNITYRVGTGENIPIESSSVELLTCAQAVHWFDFSKFCKEVDRVLKPGGCQAIIGYTPPILHYRGSLHQEMNQIFQELWHGPLDSYKPKEIAHIVNKYRDVILPYGINERDDSILIKRDMTLASFVNCIKSWSFYQLYKKDHSEDENDILEEFRLKIIAKLGEQSSDDIEMTIVESVFLLLASKPSDVQ